MIEHRQAISDIIDQIHSAPSTAMAWQQMLDFSREEFGLAFGSFTTVCGDTGEKRLPGYYMQAAMPDEWMARYNAQQYIYVDPSIALVRRTQAPLLMDIARLKANQHDPLATQLMHEFWDLGVRSAVAFRFGDVGVPISYLAGFSGDAPMREMSAMDSPPEKELRSVCQAFLSRLFHDTATGHANARPLTERQKDALRLAALAYTTEEIADLLGITSRSVQRRLNSAAIKLNARTRAQAIAHALWLGEISV
ncbi:MAG: helix-turn-helix transcriptional regulator [Alphaproteobacteria bacterium]